MHRPSTITAATALSVLAYLHLHLASAYDAVGTVVSQGILLRGVAVLAALAAVALLQFDHLAADLTGLAATCATTAVVTSLGWAGLASVGPAAGAATAVALAATGVLAGSRVGWTRRHRRLRDGLGAFVLGKLDAAEQAAFERHLRRCSRCRAEAADLASVAGVLSRVDRGIIEEMLATDRLRGSAPPRSVPAPRGEGQTSAHRTPKTW